MCYQVVLELQEDGKLISSDDPPVVFGILDNEFIQKVLLWSAAYFKQDKRLRASYSTLIHNYVDGAPRF